jgi:hypothetical protein
MVHEARGTGIAERFWEATDPTATVVAFSGHLMTPGTHLAVST